MRLAALLASLPDDDLQQLAVEHVRTDEPLSRLQLCNLLEGALRSHRFVHDFVINRQPPTFAILTALLDAPGYEVPVDGFADRCMEETRRIAKMIDDGELLSRDDGLRLYRRALHEARRNDLDLNTSEAAILSVLRRELAIAQVEHFLLEHHAELREFWDKDGAYVHEKNALRRAGIVIRHEDKLVVPEDVVPALRHTLGIDMATDAARRLFEQVNNNDLAHALEVVRSKMSGSKQARIDRLVAEWIQPRVVLRNVGLPVLREICRETGVPVTGNKDDLVDRIVAHFAQGRDQQPEPEREPPLREERRLDEEQFRTLFGVLTQQELTDILRRFPELRQSGTKEVRISTLWSAHLAEETFLSELMMRDLEDILSRLRLRIAGSKPERIARIIEHFARVEKNASGARTVTWNEEAPSEPIKLSEAVMAARDEFRRRASNPQSALQPWLEEVLDGQGLVRCYATEVPNPTQQLKNKLAQAAAARGGLLVLMLADENAYERARSALLERWGTNDEWSKSVACVALAYPLGAPAIEAIVEWSASPWPDRLRMHLFPTAKSFRAKGSDGEPIRGVELESSVAAPHCASCNSELPPDAHFCPHCGVRTNL